MKRRLFDHSQISKLHFPQVTDPNGRGELTYIEQIPEDLFVIKRVYYIYNVPESESRGGHAHKTLRQCLIALNGSFDVTLDNGSTKETFHLNQMNEGLYVPSMVWRELRNFSTGAICLCLASDKYEEEDYIRDYTLFKKLL